MNLMVTAAAVMVTIRPAAQVPCPSEGSHASSVGVKEVTNSLRTTYDI